MPETVPEMGDKPPAPGSQWQNVGTPQKATAEIFQVTSLWFEETSYLGQTGPEEGVCAQSFRKEKQEVGPGMAV